MLKKVISKKGRVMYYRDGRLVPNSEVTAEEMAETHFEEPKIEGIEETLTDDIQFTRKTIQEEVKELEKVLEPEVTRDQEDAESYDAEEVQALRKQAEEMKEEKPLNLGSCLFCGAPHEHKRGVFYKGSMLEVPMCGGCYLEKTLGEIMQKLNSKP